MRRRMRSQEQREADLGKQIEAKGGPGERKVN